MKRLLLTLSVLMVAVVVNAATVRGYVVDAETGETLAAANVFIKGSSAETTADVRGYFEINVADGTELTAAYVGYTPSSFTAESGNKAIEVRLQRSTELRDVNVLAQTSACSRRRCRLRLCQLHKSSNYHGNVNVGMLLSAIHAEGPIWKGHTSFNIAALASYFN